MNRRTFFALAAVATAVLTAFAQPARAADEPLKVGFVYVGPVGDAGWTYAHDQAAWRWKRRWAPR